MNEWAAFDGGRSIGQVSAVGDLIVCDDEHLLGARITLKRGAGYNSVSCNIYGRMDHTRFFKKASEAQREFDLMKSDLGRLMSIIQSAGPRDRAVWEAISDFVARFS